MKTILSILKSLTSRKYDRTDWTVVAWQRGNPDTKQTVSVGLRIGDALAWAEQVKANNPEMDAEYIQAGY